jgi:hypothetical protein
MDFVKKNLLSIVALAIGLAGFVAGWIISTGMAKEQIESVRQEAVQAATSINATQVDYELYAVRPGEEPWSRPRVTPNPKMTQRVGELLGAIVAQSEEVRAAAIEYNSEGKDVLVEGLFPAPEDEQAQRVSLSAEMVEKWPIAHEELLATARGGGPIQSSVLNDELEQQRTQLVEELLGSRANQQLSEQEQAEITEQLVDLRLGYLKAHADSLSFFVEPSVFTKLAEVPENGIVTQERYQTLFWDWQHAFWVHSDLIEAVVRANDGQGVSEAPIKRIFSISLSEAYNQLVTTGDLSQPITEDYSTTFTGRVGGNPLFDVRYATVDAIIDVSRLPEIENAISSSNFMTLIDLDYQTISPDMDLAAGYYYGNQSLVRATMRIETVWLRSWIEPLLPPRVREAMGLPIQSDPSAEDNSDQL